MKRADIEHVLRTLGAKNINPTTRHVMHSCLLAPWTHERGTDRKPSCGAKITDDVSPVNCFTCGTHGGMLHYVQEYASYAVPEGKISKDTIDELLNFILLSEEESEGTEDALPEKIVQPVPKEILENAGKHIKHLSGFLNKKKQPRLLGDEEWWKLWQLSYADEIKYTAIVNKEKKQRTADYRVLFPIIEFGTGYVPVVQGRWFDDDYDDEGEPKYKNYPNDSEKSKYLYGEHLWTPEITRLITVEGMMDTINGNWVLREAGITDTLVVGLMGSKASPMQIEKIKRMCSQAIILLDNDSAGKLGKKALRLGLQDSVIVYEIQYPGESYKDADDLCMAGKFLEVIDSKQSALEKDLLKIFAKGGMKV